MSKRKCIICGKPLNDGIIIYGRGICRCCEERIVNIETETDFYKYYTNSIRKTLVTSIIKGEEARWRVYQL